MSIYSLYKLFIQHSEITTDSRKTPINSLFFALKGENFDGNAYAEKALNAGSAYAIIDDPAYVKGERTILVDDVLTTMQKLAAHHRKVLGIPVIGITGSNGKTTTKELLAAVLSSKFNLLYTEGNLNNHIGVPLTLLRLNHDHEMAIIEMGASHVGEIAELCKIAQPDYGIITNVGQSHLEGFGSFENVIQAKGELYEYLRKANGTAFVDTDNYTLKTLAKGLKSISYGSSDDVFAYGELIEADPYMSFVWKQQGKLHTVNTQLVGGYNLKNALVAVAVGRFFKIPAERISRIISGYVPTNNRSQLHKTAKNVLIIDTYNANPSSMKVALENFSAMKAPKKALIIGGMKELGKDSQALHEEILKQIDHIKADTVWLCGEPFAFAAKTHNWFEDVSTLRKHIQANPLNGYQVLIKGSHSIELEKVIDVL